MKSIKLFVSLFVVSLLMLPSHATTIENYISWDGYADGSASIKYTSDYDDKSKYFEAEISHSSSGYQRLYFNDHPSVNNSICKYENRIPDSSNIVFNGQAVRMLRWCKKYGDSNDYYYSIAPEAGRGNNYVINLFKTATLPIEIKYNSETLYFPVIGFTKEWNSASGDAI